MTKYQLHVFNSSRLEQYTVFADRLEWSNSGVYAFYCDKELVATYPISRTAIVSLETVDEE